MTRMDKVVKEVWSLAPKLTAFNSRIVPIDRSVQIGQVGGPNLKWLVNRCGVKWGKFPARFREGLAKWLQKKGETARDIIYQARLEEIVELVKDFNTLTLTDPPNIHIVLGEIFADYLVDSTGLPKERIMHLLSQSVKRERLSVNEIYSLEGDYHKSRIDQHTFFL